MALDLETVSARVRRLEENHDATRRALDGLREAVGSPPTATATHGEGLAGAVARLTAVVGRAPNDATGELGAGLSRVVAELAASQRDARRDAQREAQRWARWAGGGAAGAVGVAELVSWLLRTFAGG